MAAKKNKGVSKDNTITKLFKKQTKNCAYNFKCQF